jgi:hypothetical protein
MGIRQTARRLGPVGLVLALGACDHGLESVTTIDAVCSFQTRVAILVETSSPDDREIDSVTASLGRSSEQSCFLEKAPGRHAASDGDDSGVVQRGLYSCLEQGIGTYTVRVKSGKQTWTQDVAVVGDECHVKGLQHLFFELD